MYRRHGYMRTPHIYRDEIGNTYVDGYRYYGRFGTPPMPNRHALTDRSTDETYVIGMDESGEIELQSINSRWTDVTYHDKYNDGPYSNEYRIFLEDGELQAEYAPGYGSSLMIARASTGRAREALLIEVDDQTGLVTTSEYTL